MNFLQWWANNKNEDPDLYIEKAIANQAWNAAQEEIIKLIQNSNAWEFTPKNNVFIYWSIFSFKLI